MFLMILIFDMNNKKEKPIKYSDLACLDLLNDISTKIFENFFVRHSLRAKIKT